jgi:hypothetical protein
MRDLLSGCAEVAVFEFEAFGKTAEKFGGFLGDLGVGVLGAEEVVVAEKGSEWLRLRSSRVKA